MNADDAIHEALRGRIEDLEARVDELESQLEALNRARLYNRDRTDELQEENQALRDRVAELERETEVSSR